MPAAALHTRLDGIVVGLVLPRIRTNLGHLPEVSRGEALVAGAKRDVVLLRLPEGRAVSGLRRVVGARGRRVRDAEALDVRLPGPSRRLEALDRRPHGRLGLDGLLDGRAWSGPGHGCGLHVRGQGAALEPVLASAEHALATDLALLPQHRHHGSASRPINLVLGGRWSGLRAGLHAGPVVGGMEPVPGRLLLLCQVLQGGRVVHTVHLLLAAVRELLLVPVALPGRGDGARLGLPIAARPRHVGGVPGVLVRLADVPVPADPRGRGAEAVVRIRTPRLGLLQALLQFPLRAVLARSGTDSVHSDLLLVRQDRAR
mmetsp:Transcript_90723/g.236292  ORF Transcript_90723/g.236292 Transcript_90723/m.236292 type:complete len:315 (+) Transcript_90723:293-1237(+)